MARVKKERPRFEGMDPSEGARLLLRYIWELSEENADRLDRMERYFAAMYQMIHEIHSGGGMVRSAPREPLIPPQVVDAARAAARSAAEKLFNELQKKAWKFLR